MNNSRNLAEFIINHWSRPLKTVSFWVVSLFLMFLKDEIHNNTSFDTVIGFEATSYILFVLMIFTYLYSAFIDNAIMSVLKKQINEDASKESYTLSKPKHNHTSKRVNDNIKDTESKKISGNKPSESDPWKRQ